MIESILAVIACVAFLILLALKTLGGEPINALSWWWVFSPLLIYMAVIMVFVLIPVVHDYLWWR